jgi:protein SCO1/2
MHTQLRPVRLMVAALALLVVAGAALALALGPSGHGGSGTAGTTSVSSAASAGPAPELDGAPLPGNVQAPGFTLSNQSGRTVSLGEYRGRVVVLAFLYTTCGGACVLIAQQIRGALDELAGEHERAPAVLIVSADPAADTRARVRGFLAEVSLTGRAEYLTGPLPQLRRIWRAYHVRPASAGRAAFAEYASVLLVDGAGAERVLFQSEQLTPEAIAHDVAKLEQGGRGSSRAAGARAGRRGRLRLIP